MAAVNPVVTGFNLILPSVKCRLAHKFLVVLIVFMIVCKCVCVHMHAGFYRRVLVCVVEKNDS